MLDEEAELDEEVLYEVAALDEGATLYAEARPDDEWELDGDEADYDGEPYDEPTGSRLGSPWVKLAIVIVVVGILAFEAFVLWGGSDSDHDSSRRQAGRGGPGRPPAELPAVGAYVRSEVLGSGRIEVLQWIRSATPLTSLLLEAHDAPLPPETAQARHLDVVTGGGRVVVSDGVVGATPTKVDLGGPTKVVRLRYELTGVVDRASSVSGRALAGVTFLDVDYLPEAGPARVLVSGPAVLNLSCADRASETALRRPCGAPRGSGWQVTLAGPDRDDRVAAQLDLG
jgi:hypothetical protein